MLLCRYEDDPILGHRLYREIRRVEYAKESSKRTKGKGASSGPVISYQWEAVASNFDEFNTAAVSLELIIYISLGSLLINRAMISSFFPVPNHLQL